MSFFKNLGNSIAEDLKEKQAQYEKYCDYASRLSDERLIKELKSSSPGSLKRTAFHKEARERGLISSN